MSSRLVFFGETICFNDWSKVEGQWGLFGVAVLLKFFPQLWSIQS